MTHTTIFIALLAFCVTFLILAFRAENRAWEWEQRYNRLRTKLVQLECELTPKFDKDDPEFLAGWNMAMGKIKGMVKEVRKNA